MSVFESVHENLLQGVSQQVPRSRLPGQVEMQENMVSDPVTGLRRRPGSTVRFTVELPQATQNSILSWRTDISGVGCDCILDIVTGTLALRETRSSEVSYLQSDYLKALDTRMVRHASVGESLFLANISVIPTKVVAGSGAQDPNTTGWAHIRSSALSKQFSVTITHDGGSFTGSYTTPDGTDPSHIALTTPEYIAEQIATSLGSSSPEVNIYRTGSYLFFTRPSGTTMSVTTDSGSLYVGTSKTMQVRDVSDLPARLPSQANGCINTVGLSPNVTYYRYDSPNERWVETASYGSPTGIQGVPVEVYWDSDTDQWVIDETLWAGRTAGDDYSNPDPDFVDWGISGITSYQGRLVVMAGSWVCLSSTTDPRVFYRTTVEELLDSDPIGIGSSSATSAAFQYGVPFNKDLVLFSNEFQALIPGGNTAVTPSNINLVVTSNYSVDPSSPPIVLGATLMYSTPRSANFFGLMEMIPSPYSDSQYLSMDSTEHIPRYLAGRCRFSSVSPVGGLAVFGSTRDSHALYVHEYVWAGEEKALRAWHRWTFKYPVASAYFSNDLVHIVTVQNGVVVVATVDARSGANPDTSNTNSFIDYSATADVTLHPSGEYKQYELDAAMEVFFGDDATEMVTAYQGGLLDGYELGTEPAGAGVMKLSKATTAETVIYGMPYVSKFAPSPPQIRDGADRVVTTGNLRLVRYYVSTAGSGEFDVAVWDTSNQTQPREWAINPVRWNSTELSLGKAPVSGVTCTIVPCRVNAESSQVVFTAKGLAEFNVLGLEYICKYNQRRRRV